MTLSQMMRFSHFLTMQIKKSVMDRIYSLESFIYMQHSAENELNILFEIERLAKKHIINIMNIT